MHDDYRSDDALQHGSAQGGSRKAEDARRFADREVPLDTGEGRVFSPAVHAWLDGDLPEAAVRKGETARDVDFWNRLTHEAERRRHMRTPAHVEAQIMAALPQTAPQLITPWYRREFVITPAAAAIAAASLVVVAAAATIVLLQVLA